jgi:hypothetical protein
LVWGHSNKFKRTAGDYATSGREETVKRITPLLCIVIILFLFLGIYAGHKVTAANKDTEIMDLQVQLETANTELAFWKNTLRSLAEGNQILGVDLKGRPSTGD